MATMSKSSGTTDTLRGGAGYAVSDDSGRALANATETWMAAATECQREVMSFVSMRLGKDAETTREIAACKNLADVTAIQSRWIEETLRDYSAEMGTLMTICTKSVDGAGRTRG
jgi:hypothetical protein